ncbi:MAG: tRNA pseudouridine(55) synthase TruB [Lachnospiraceae bacterium]|nr:tRNA pseudouridine(55) synthase TruB [Lachnospiraceae bacterium]
MSDTRLVGVLPVFKERGYTSNDVVAKLRGILRMKKIGHTGTLDPDAVGVLPVCLGKATKLVGYLTDTDKTYSCCMRLGVTTDTEDMTGTITATKDTSDIKENDIRDAILSFIGGYDQIPPMYSAKKINGKKLYELAREGKVVERKPAKVFIRNIDGISVDRDDDTVRVYFTVECSKGTYIRSLCRDIGEALGVGAAMESLKRIKAAGIDISDCMTLSEIEEKTKNDSIKERLLPIDSFYKEEGRYDADVIQEKYIRNGNSFVCRGVEDGRYRVYLPDGTFAALYDIKKNEARLCRYFLG